MIRNKRSLSFVIPPLVLKIVNATGYAQDMVHGQHGDPGTMVMQFEMGGADDQMAHGHGQGM